MKKRIAVIGSGFAGLSSAALLAQQGYEVSLFEKNYSYGGRARVFSEDQFIFDMGPSWYWMPEVFEKYYNLFGKTTSDFYDLLQLDPSFRVFFDNNEQYDISSDFLSVCNLFESIEKGAGDKLRKFMIEAEYKYIVGMQSMVYKPAFSIFEFINKDVLKGVFRLQLFNSFRSHVKKYFKSPRLLALMEFPILFLGAKPSHTPALYSIMNYACFKLGTWYPMGGFGKIVDAFVKIAQEQGVQMNYSSAVDRLTVVDGMVKEITSNHKKFQVDALLGTADYHHIERDLLPPAFRSYSEKYWNARTLAPSCLIFYLGIKGKLPNLLHHNLFFDEQFDQHANEIYSDKRWPTRPLFYVCCPSKTDSSVAPLGHENLFILMPIAAGLTDCQQTRDNYFAMLIERVEKKSGGNIKDNIVVKKSYSVSDFSVDYNAYKGNAYGLANTLMQTAIFKPSMRSKKVNNLFFAGQLTVPGPGVPPSIISGQIASNQVHQYLQKK